MTRIPTRAGDRYLCFIVVREDRGWGGPYGQTRRPMALVCEDCGYAIKVAAWAASSVKLLADHHEHGHTPCTRCGQQLLRRKDGSPRQHAHNRCPGKAPGDKIEREFVKHMAQREYT